jgi:D-alanine-D-alanine ligase
MKNVIVFLGGKSPEREVSVITGIQVVENIDRNKYNPIIVYVSEKGEFFKLKNFYKRKDFKISPKKKVYFNFNEKTDKIYICGFLFKKEIYCAYNTMHGGNGEKGQMAGFFETYNIPYTSSNPESAVLSMNKSLSKKIVSDFSVPTIPGLTYKSSLIKKDVKSVRKNIQEFLGSKVIIKPVHLGSSIGISIKEGDLDIELGLLEASNLDSEILIEKYLEDISEYNVSVKKINDEVIVSQIERPLPKDIILSFKEKYQKGGKKISGGMASLNRELPANIDEVKRQKLQDYAKTVYEALSSNGLVRIDFISSKEEEIFFNEINPIPGSMSFYLWEVDGISFTEQITELIEESVNSCNLRYKENYVYKTDIIDNFIKS